MQMPGIASQLRSPDQKAPESLWTHSPEEEEEKGVQWKGTASKERKVPQPWP